MISDDELIQLVRSSADSIAVRDIAPEEVSMLAAKRDRTRHVRLGVVAAAVVVVAATGVTVVLASHSTHRTNDAAVPSALGSPTRPPARLGPPMCEPPTLVSVGGASLNGTARLAVTVVGRATSASFMMGPDAGEPVIDVKIVIAAPGTRPTTDLQTLVTAAAGPITSQTSPAPGQGIVASFAPKAEGNYPVFSIIQYRLSPTSCGDPSSTHVGSVVAQIGEISVT